MNRLVAAVALAVATFGGYFVGASVTASAHTAKQCQAVRSDVAATKNVLNAARHAGLDEYQTTNANAFEAILDRALAHCP